MPSESIFFLALKQLKVIYCEHLRKCNDALEVMSQECVGSKTRSLAKELRRWSNQKSFDLRISIYMKYEQKCMCVSWPSQHCMYNNMFPNYSTVDRTMEQILCCLHTSHTALCLYNLFLSDSVRVQFRISQIRNLKMHPSRRTLQKDEKGLLFYTYIGFSQMQAFFVYKYTLLYRFDVKYCIYKDKY